MIRRAVPAGLVGMPVAGVEAVCAQEGHPFRGMPIREALGPLLAQATLGDVLVVQEQSMLRGYAVLTWGWSLESGGRAALLDEIYVVEQRRGLGSQLLAACCSEPARPAPAPSSWRPSGQ